MKKFLTLIFISFLFSNHSIAGWFDKNKIKVSKCYEVGKYKSYKDQKNNVVDLDWRAEINKKENTVVMSTTSMGGKVSLWKAKIDVKTDRFVGTYPDKHGLVFLFDLDRDTVTSKGGPLGGQTLRKCKFS